MVEVPCCRRHERRGRRNQCSRAAIHIKSEDRRSHGRTERPGPDPDGDRAERTRRARVRHLLAPAEGTRRVPGRARSTRRPPTWSSRRCCSWNPRIRTRTSISTSTRRAARSRPGMAVYDTMQFIKPDVSTLCVGMAASMGAFLLAAGAKGKRFALPNSDVMIHQPLGGFQGQASDVEIHAKYILSLRERLNVLMAKHTGKPVEQIARDHRPRQFPHRRAGARVRNRRQSLAKAAVTRVKSIESTGGQALLMADKSSSATSFFIARSAARASTRSASSSRARRCSFATNASSFATTSSARKAPAARRRAPIAASCPRRTRSGRSSTST